LGRQLQGGLWPLAFQLIIIGRRESTGEIRDVLFGSVANYVLHNVACPVLLF